MFKIVLDDFPEPPHRASDLFPHPTRFLVVYAAQSPRVVDCTECPLTFRLNDVRDFNQ